MDSNVEPRLFREGIGCRRFEGKNILVTAGTLGIGRAIVERLCQEGAHVFTCSRKVDNVNATIKELEAKGYKCAGIPCNVGKKEDLEAFVKAALKEFKSDTFHGLVLNAAVNPAAGNTLDLSSTTYDKIMNVNVKANFELIKLARPYLKPGSSIVLVASTGGLSPSPPIGIYNVSKSALISMGRVLSQDLGPKGIRVNCLAPGLVKTKFAEMLWKGKQGQKFASTLSLRRLGEPEDMAGPTAFLLSDDSEFMTGETIVVSGGTQGRL